MGYIFFAKACAVGDTYAVLNDDEGNGEGSRRGTTNHFPVVKINKKPIMVQFNNNSTNANKTLTAY
jgi:hypothetical protein